LALSGIWAFAQIAVLTLEGRSAKVAVYMIGLMVGFATVWAWLYFCFAYSGRSLHRNRAAGRLALGIFGVVLLVKLTNPIHHLYFTTEWAAHPFAHLAVQNHVLHWVTFGLAYTLSAIGIFVLFEFFAGIATNTWPLVGLVGLTSLPALLNAAGHATDYLLDVGHEPLGVAAFAVGVLFVYDDEFHDVRLAGISEAPAIVIDELGQIRTCNREAAALFPSLRAEVAGRSLEDVLPRLARARTGDPPLLKLGEEAPRYFSVFESRLGGVHTRPGTLLLLNEVTEQKRREAALRAAKEEAEEASQLKSSILANMKHEVQTPLTSMLSFAGVLMKNVSGQNERYVELVIRGGERLKETLDSVIRLSKLETGTVEVDREDVDLTRVAKTTTELLRPRAEDDDLRLSLDVPDDPVTGMWDEDALFHIAENLLENALKFTPDGGTVWVRVREERSTAVLEVEDTGIGIGGEDRSEIFEVFRQVERGSEQDRSGSGLGLPIVKKLVDGLDGTIEVDSEIGQGSCFTVRLPLARSISSSESTSPDGEGASSHRECFPACSADAGSAGDARSSTVG
jgi:signal transduction histidine kinase